MVIDRDFFRRDTLTAARELIGCVLVRSAPWGEARGIIVETEAYLGRKDAAAHSYKGKTERVRILYGEKGMAYIYLIYGMYNCLNISSGESPEPECILIRALEPLPPTEAMERRRKSAKPKNLCSGPGKLCMALDIDRGLYGADMCSAESPLYIEYAEPLETEASPRIGVDYAGKDALLPYRFTAKGSKFLSK